VTSSRVHTITFLANPNSIIFPLHFLSFNAAKVPAKVSIRSKMKTATTSMSPILNVFGDRIGEYSGEDISTSIVFTNGAMLNDQEKGFVYDALGNRRITKTVEKLTTNGDWACDYSTGLIVVKKATTGTSQTLTAYKVRTGGGGGSPSNPSEIQGKDADNAPATANPVIVAAEYNSSAPTYANGDASSLQSDVNGNLKQVAATMPVAEDNPNGVYATSFLPLAVSNYAWSADISAALEASTVTKASAGLLRQITGRIDSSAGSATYYLQAYNASSLPADGAVTMLITPIKIVHTTGTNTNFTVDLTMNGVYASTGIVVALSSTEFTKTITAALLSTLVLYK